MATHYVQDEDIINLLGPVDIVATETDSNWMDLSNAHDASFLVYFGVISSSSTTDTGKVYVEASSVSVSGAETQVPFSYRLSGAAGTNTWGSITAVSADVGAPLALGSDGMCMHIQIDPSVIDALSTTVLKRWVRVALTPEAQYDHTNVCVLGVTRPRFKGNTMVDISS